jgi:hypothetical protein
MPFAPFEGMGNGCYCFRRTYFTVATNSPSFLIHYCDVVFFPKCNMNIKGKRFGSQKFMKQKFFFLKLSSGQAFVTKSIGKKCEINLWFEVLTNFFFFLR